MKQKKKKRSSHKRQSGGVYQTRGKDLVRRVDDVIVVNKTAQNDTTMQYMVDMFCIALNNPEVMGKDVFGKKRLKKVILAVSAEYNKYKGIFIKSSEQDYLQEVLDRRLKQIFGDDLVPFSERYDWIEQPKY